MQIYLPSFFIIIQGVLIIGFDIFILQNNTSYDHIQTNISGKKPSVAVQGPDLNNRLKAAVWI